MKSIHLDLIQSLCMESEKLRTDLSEAQVCDITCSEGSYRLLTCHLPQCPCFGASPLILQAALLAARAECAQSLESESILRSTAAAAAIAYESQQAALKV